MIDHAVEGLVALAGGGDERLRPVASWPEGRERNPQLAAAAEAAVSQGEGVIHSSELEDGSGRVRASIGYPLTSEGVVQGVVGLTVDNCSRSELQDVLRQLQWGTGHLLAALGRADARRLRGVVTSVTAALDLVSAAVSLPDFDEAVLVASATLAERTGARRASVGLIEAGRMRVAGISGRSEIDRRTVLVRRLTAALDETAQRDELVDTGAAADAERVPPTVAALARESGHPEILAAPMRAGSRVIGALLLEGDEAFDPSTVRVLQTAAQVLGPLLDARRRERMPFWRRWRELLLERVAPLLGPGHPGQKLASAAALVAVVFFAFARGDYRVDADTVLEAGLQRTLAAPFDGYVASSSRSAGDSVSEGDELARLDDREPMLDRLRWSRERARYQKELQHGRASGDRVQAELAKAEIAQTEAHISLLDEQLERAVLRAPFDGVVIDGDLSQMLGSPVRRGDTLFRVAPLSGYRVILQVDERDVAALAAGQRGELRLTSLPGESFDLEVVKVTPVATAEEGRNYFRAEGVLDEPSASLRPGMEGVSKVVVGRRQLLWIWTHGLFDWLRLKVWAWLP
jgi:multidrug efflux pump subunit AcrA (membrane-fusion protein)